VTGKLPYGKAVAHDSYYKNFVNNDYDGFWNMIGPKIGNVSSDFKSLVSLMLSFDPAQRPSTNEIKNHPWFADKCISQQEMVTELEKRKVVVTQQRKIEAEKKENQKKLKSGNTRVYKTGVYKGEKSNEGETEVDFNNELELTLERDIGFFYDLGSSPYNVSTNETNEKNLFVSVYRYFMEKDNKTKKIDINKKHYSLKINYLPDAETKQLLEGLNYDNLEIKVDLKKLNDETLIIEFTKIKGDKGEFYEIYENFTSTQEFKF